MLNSKIKSCIFQIVLRLIIVGVDKCMLSIWYSETYSVDNFLKAID